MHTLLSLSTSTARGSVALLRDGALLAERHYLDERRHAERLFDEIDALLQATGVTRAQLTAVVCDVGPGSFTGTRVGLASGKGIALGLGIPLWPACSLRAMALAALASGAVTSARVAPCVDAKRGEIFYALYDRALNALQPPSQHKQQALLPWLLAQAAEGAVACGQVLAALPSPPPAHVDHPACAFPDARWLAELAARDFATADPPPLATIEPIYVRPPDAVPNLPAPPVLLPSPPPGTERS